MPLDTLIALRREILAGTRVGPPRQLLSGSSITNYYKECDRRQMTTSKMSCVGDSADAVHYVDSLKAAGADMIKPRTVRPPMFFILRRGAASGHSLWGACDGADSRADRICMKTL